MYGFSQKFFDLVSATGILTVVLFEKRMEPLKENKQESLIKKLSINSYFKELRRNQSSGLKFKITLDDGNSKDAKVNIAKACLMFGFSRYFIQ